MVAHGKKEYLNKDNYFQLLSREKDSEILEYIEDTIKCCTSYVQAVDMMETQIITARFRMEQEQYKDFITNIDARRRALHNDAIESTSFLNRVAKANGLGDIFIGNKEDRYQVADFCLQLTNAIFEARKKK